MSMKIDVLGSLVRRPSQQACAFAPAASVTLPPFGAVWLSLKTEESGPNRLRFGELEDIRQSQQGDADAYRRLIERHQDHIGKLLWRFTRDKNSHEELVQETFVQAYFSLRTYQAHAPFEHWLTRIATRVGYHFWREQARHQHVEMLDDAWDAAAQPDEPATTPAEAAAFLHRLLAQLPPRDRMVLTLRYLEQCDVAETARRTGWNPTMVKVQTYRAKQKLKALAQKADMEIEL